MLPRPAYEAHMTSIRTLATPALLALAPAATGLWVTAEAIGFATPVVWTAVERRAARSRFTAA